MRRIDEIEARVTPVGGALWLHSLAAADTGWLIARVRHLEAALGVQRYEHFRDDAAGSMCPKLHWAKDWPDGCTCGVRAVPVRMGSVTTDAHNTAIDAALAEDP